MKYTYKVPSNISFLFIIFLKTLVILLLQVLNLSTLTVSNLIISSVISDTFRKATSAIIKYDLDYTYNLDIDYTTLLHRRLLPKAEKINLSIISKDYQEQISILSTIPGITPNSTVGIIFEIEVDMAKFYTSVRGQT